MPVFYFQQLPRNYIAPIIQGHIKTVKATSFKYDVLNDYVLG